MSEFGVFYFRPGGGPARGVPEVDFREYLQSVRILLRIPTAVLARLSDELAEYRGFLGETQIESIVARHVERAESRGLVYFISQTPEVIRALAADTSQLLEAIAKWQAAPGLKELALNQDELAGLSEPFRLLGRSFPGQVRQAKAEWLASATGLAAEAIDLVCDVRAVFNEGRNGIEGLIPITTLRIVASGVDRFPVAFEVKLSARDVQALLQKAEQAVQKLNALGRLAEQVSLPVPALGLTETAG